MSPPETPEFTYREILACLSKRGALKLAPTEFKKVNEECMEEAKGLTKFEFGSLIMGCVSIEDDSTIALCDSATEKLRPQFKPEGPLPSATGLTAAELAALEAGCRSLRDTTHYPQQRARCASGFEKLKNLLLKPLAPNALETIRIEPPISPTEYVALVRSAPYWITSPRGDAMWLMDPMGRLVRRNDGNPVSVPFSATSK